MKAILNDADCLNPEGEVNERWGTEKEERTLALLRFLPFRSRWPVDPFSPERVLCRQVKLSKVEPLF